MNTIRAGKHLFATNLFWQRIIGAGSAPTAARQQAGKLPPEIGRFRQIVVRRKARQYGVSSVSNAAHAPGMFSAAAVLADVIEGSWAGVFDVQEGWYFLVSKRGDIHPDSDRLFARNESDQARRALEEALQDDKITMAYAPAEFNIGKTSERPIEPVLEKASRGLARFMSTNRMAPLDHKAATIRVAVRTVPWVATAVGSFAVGPLVWQLVDNWVNPPPPPRVVKVTNPWEDLPAAGALLENCVTALLNYPELPGATLKAADCHRNTVSYHYSPYVGIALSLIENEKAVKGCQLLPEGTSGLALTCGMNNVRRIGRQAPLAEQVANQRLWDVVGSTGATLTLSLPSALSPSDPNHPELGPVGKAITVSAKLTFPPDGLAASASAVPAFTVSAITYTPPRAWTFEGTVYVQ